MTLSAADIYAIMAIVIGFQTAITVTFTVYFRLVLKEAQRESQELLENTKLMRVELTYMREVLLEVFEGFDKRVEVGSGVTRALLTHTGLIGIYPKYREGILELREETSRRIREYILICEHPERRGMACRDLCMRMSDEKTLPRLRTAALLRSNDKELQRWVVDLESRLNGR